MSIYTVDRTKWQTQPLGTQLANIGAEVGRSFAHTGKGRSITPALERSLDLFDATVESRDLGSARRKEVLRAKEVYVRTYFDGSKNDQRSLEQYFTNYAFLRGK